MMAWVLAVLLGASKTAEQDWDGGGRPPIPDPIPPR